MEYGDIPAIKWTKKASPCFKMRLSKGGNTSYLAKQLSDKHPNLFKEFKDQQVVVD